MFSPATQTSSTTPPFFTAYSANLRAHNVNQNQTHQISNRLLRLLFASPSLGLNRFHIQPFSNQFLFKPYLRRKVTNLVFLGAFISACLCVGGQSINPNGGFHSNVCKNNQHQKGHHQGQVLNGSNDHDVNDDRLNHSHGNKISSRKLLSLFCPVWLLDTFRSFFSPINKLDSNPACPQTFKQQRRWIKEESP